MAPTSPQRPATQATASTRPASGVPNQGQRQAAGAAGLKVRAIKDGYYDDVRRRVGDVFVLRPREAIMTETIVDKDGKPKLQPDGITPRTKEVKRWLTVDEQFSDKWMEKVAADTPERITTGQEEIRRQHDEEIKARLQPGQRVGPDDVPENIPPGTRNPLGA